MIFVGGRAFSQQLSQNKSLKALAVFAKKPVNTTFLHSFTEIATPISILPLNADYYSCHLGFFCKQEIKFEKTTKIPFKFRLGSVQQCDWLEGKPNSASYKQ